MADPTEFVTARLDEEEAAAELAAREGGTWKQDDPERRPGAISSLGGPVVYDEGAPDEYQAIHIARHDPARALREIAAKRAMVEKYKLGRRLWNSDAEEWFSPAAAMFGSDMEWLIKTLAAVWSDHPDYREE